MLKHIVDLSKILKNYRSGWVSISADHKKVLASSNSLDALIKKLQKMGNPKGYVVKATKDFGSYVG